MKEFVSEEKIAGNLKEILSSYLEKQLSVLWRGKPSNPATLLVKASILFVFVIDSWIYKH
jgi:hypothetical protein